MLSAIMPATSFAQRIPSTSMKLAAPAKGAVAVPFSTDRPLSQYITPAQPVEWGLDVAWNWDQNVVRGTNAITKEVLKVGRVSFQPSIMKDDKTLSDWQIANLQSRLNNIAMSGVRNIALNCDHEVLMEKEKYPDCDANYAKYYGHPEEWYKVIKATMDYCLHHGFNVVTISPFNEPDYDDWKEGTQADFKAIAQLISEDPYFKGVRISGGNTLNCDQAASWYNYLKPYVTEGNTHQLAGTMANYTKFWDTVRNDGNHATADELHNTMEAFIGIHHGMQTGIWWGWDAIARGEFCKASYFGKEIGYAEDQATWTGAAVYKWNRRKSSASEETEERINAFAGASERQAKPQYYDFISTDRPAYFDGYGPVYSYQQHIPADPNGKYQGAGQKNAERILGVQYGEDVPTDYIRSGQYVIMNEKSKYALSYPLNGNVIQQIYYRRYPADYNMWAIEPVAEDCGGDFSYSTLRTPGSTDGKNITTTAEWALEEGIGLKYDTNWAHGTRNEFYFEYAGDNFWYIRNRYTGLYLGVKGGSTNQNVPVVMQAFTGNAEQRWRFIPVNTADVTATGKLELDAPAAPAEVKVERLSAAALITWTPNTTDTDVVGYNVLRAKVSSAPLADQWDVIGRMVKGTQFIDNDMIPGESYIYKVKTVDRSRNISEASPVTQPVTLNIQKVKDWKGGELIAHYGLNSDANDDTRNQMDAVLTGTENYAAPAKGVKEGDKAMHFSGDNFLTLPPSVGAMREMTICMWVYNESSNISWTRLFDFGSDQDHYFFLTPGNGSQMRLVMKNGGEEEIISAPKLGPWRSVGWQHIAVTLSEDSVSLYVGTDKVYTSKTMKIRPADFMPKRCYIGASQYAADPLFKGYIDDIRIYNYALSADQVATLRAYGEMPDADVNKDGKVTVEDASIVANYFLSNIQSSGYVDVTPDRNNHIYDIDCDDKITLNDAKTIVNIYLTK